MRPRPRHPTERFHLSDDYYLQAVDRLGRRPLADPLVTDVYGRTWRLRRHTPLPALAVWVLLGILAIALIAASVGAFS
jgi:hypothetical protein